MTQTVLITLTLAGADTGPFDLYSDADSYATPFETGISKVSLEGGYTSVVVPDTANVIRVMSTSVLCSNYVDLPIESTTTTTTSTTTTSPVLNFSVDRYICGTCSFTSNEVLDSSEPVIIGKYYILADLTVGHVTGNTASVATTTLGDSTAYDLCGDVPCP